VQLKVTLSASTPPSASCSDEEDEQHSSSGDSGSAASHRFVPGFSHRNLLLVWLRGYTRKLSRCFHFRCAKLLHIKASMTVGQLHAM